MTGALTPRQGARSDGTSFQPSSFLRSSSEEPFTPSTLGSNIQFYTVPTGTIGALERVRISASGNVGIGTTNPTEKLFVGGGNIGTLRTSSDYNVVALTNTGGVQVHLNANGNAEGNLRTVTNHPLSFSTNNIERMKIDTSGSVGIGTTSPAVRLDLNTNGWLRGAGAYIEDHDGTLGKKARLYNYNESFSVSREAAGFGYETALFEVNLNTGTTTIVGTTTCTIGNGTGATNCTSDERLKQHIKPITGALDKLSQINGVSFHWKDTTKAGPEHIGVIAQDVEKVFPQVVSSVPDKSLGAAKTVDIAALIAPMIEAIKELKASNDDLRREFDAYKAAHP